MVEETKFVFGKLFWCDSIHAALFRGTATKGRISSGSAHSSFQYSRPRRREPGESRSQCPDFRQTEGSWPNVRSPYHRLLL